MLEKLKQLLERLRRCRRLLLHDGSELIPDEEIEALEEAIQSLEQGK